MILVFGFFISNLFAGSFALSGEWLYMMLSLDQPEFVIDSTSGTNPIGKRKANEQGYRTGYRAEGHYSFCEGVNDVALRWTHFPKLVMQQKRSGSELFGILNHPVDPIAGVAGEARIRDKFVCYFFDGLFKRKVICTPSFSFTLLGGVQYGYLSFKEKVTYDIADARFIEARSLIKGVGPEIGAEYFYRFLKSWYFGGCVNNGWLVSKTSQSYQDVENDGTIHARTSNGTYRRFVPTLDMRLGIGFSPLGDLKSSGYKPSCFSVDIEVGYEMIAFFHGSDRIYFVDKFNRGSSFNEKQTFSLHGPYVHLGVVF